MYNGIWNSFRERKDSIVNITEYTVEKINDPTGILTGDRYEFFLSFEVSEDDELFEEKGLQLKVLFSQDENGAKILNYHFYNSIENKYLDFELEEEEEQVVKEFCQAHIEENE